MDVAISTTDLTKIFTTEDSDIVAVDHISFNIEPGKIIGLLGPNGAGKTTTIRLIASLLTPSSGTSKVNGKNSVKESLLVRSLIGLSHEKPSFYRGLTGRRNLRFYGELYGVPSDVLNQRIDDLAKDFELSDAIDQPVGSYSKGMTQKLSVCKALIHDAPIIILDEPWSGLSPGATRDLRQKIKSLGENYNKTILITTHNLAQAELVVDDLIIIANGKLIAMGTPNELRNKYHVVPELELKFTDTLNISESELHQLDYIEDVMNFDDSVYLKVKITDFSYTPELIHLLVNRHGAKIREVKEVIPSLEDIYLKLVETD